MTAQQLVGYQYPCTEVIPELKALCNGEPHSVCLLMKAYVYGVMAGKRAERARRKGRAK